MASHFAQDGKKPNRYTPQQGSGAQNGYGQQGAYGEQGSYGQQGGYAEPDPFVSNDYYQDDYAGYGNNGAGDQFSYQDDSFDFGAFPANDDGLVRHKHKKKKHTGRNIAIVCAIVVVLLGVLGGVEAFALINSAKTVKSEASAIMAQVTTVKDAIKKGDSDALNTSVQTIRTKTNNINKEVNTTAWNVAAMVPVYGQDVKSIQKLGATASNLVEDALIPVADGLSGLKLSELLQDGAVNVSILEKLISALEQASPVVQTSAETINSLPEAHISQLKSILDKVKDPLSQAGTALEQAEPILKVLPQMLGADGQTKNYLVVAQNNAEIRATGGFPGATGIVSVTDGKISMGDFQAIGKLGGDDYAEDQDPKEAAMFSHENDVTPQIITCNPDFPVSAKHLAHLWNQRMGTMPDGVIALDPTVLQGLLGLVGAVTAPDGEVVDGTNAAEVLLNGTYKKFGNDGTAQDEYFSAVAGLAFKQVMNNLGDADLDSLLTLLDGYAKENRILAWMQDADEQAAVVTFNLAGDVAEDPTTPEIGVYINDNTWAKMTWYMSVNTTVGTPLLSADGTRTYQVTTVIRNNITADEAASVPTYITGYNPDLTGVGNMIEEVMLYAPAGGTISNIDCDLGNTFTQGTYSSLQTWRTGTQIQIAPQHEAVITYTVTTSPEATSELTVRTTPTAQVSAGW